MYVYIFMYVYIYSYIFIYVIWRINNAITNHNTLTPTICFIYSYCLIFLYIFFGILIRSAFVFYFSSYYYSYYFYSSYYCLYYCLYYSYLYYYYKVDMKVSSKVSQQKHATREISGALNALKQQLQEEQENSDIIEKERSALSKQVIIIKECLFIYFLMCSILIFNILLYNYDIE